MKRSIALLFFIVFSLTGYSQVKVTGVVVNSRNKPLSGATVFEKGTLNGTFTDEQGRFNIEADSSNPVIVAEYVGYDSIEVMPSDYSNVKIVLKRKLLNGGGPYVGMTIPYGEGVGFGINAGANIPIQKILTVVDVRTEYYWKNSVCWLSFSGGLYKEVYDRYCLHLNVGPQFRDVDFSQPLLHFTPEVSMRYYIIKKIDLRIAYGYRWVPCDKESSMFQLRITNTFN
ncbi:MAG: carboxypeptidase-like regulatory domain-containing protein [Crocinitomicaceae bacterium]